MDDKSTQALDLTGYANAIASLEKSIAHYLTEKEGEYKDISRDSSIQRFEYVFEFSHKILRRYLSWHVPAPQAKISEIPFAVLVKIGATNVGRIAVDYKKDWFTNSMPPPANRKALFTKWEAEQTHAYTKGQEIARFEMGSTVILVCNRAVRQRTKYLFAELEGKKVFMGQGLMV